MLIDLVVVGLVKPIVTTFSMYKLLCMQGVWFGGPASVSWFMKC